MSKPPAGPRKPFRITRGESSGYATTYYRTEQARDRAACRYADQDGETVLTEVWAPEHSQDPINRGWASDGAVRPYADELAALDFDPDPGDRIPAVLIAAGDRVTVFAFEPDGLMDPMARAEERRGTVATVDLYAGTAYGRPFLRVTFTDGRTFDAVHGAVTTRHHNPVAPETLA